MNGKRQNNMRNVFDEKTKKKFEKKTKKRIDKGFKPEQIYANIVTRV